MQLILEAEGVLLDIAAAWHDAHCKAATQVGWSSLESGTFWRLLRAKGREAALLPAAKPAKLKEYWERFDSFLEDPDVLTRVTLHDDAVESVNSLVRFGKCHVVTLHRNVEARSKAIRRIPGASPLPLSPDPRRRPAELRSLAGSDPRTILAGATDSLLRTAGEAGLFRVGISRGCCTSVRLHQGGLEICMTSLSELVEALQNGGGELVRAGLLPASVA